MKPISMFDPNSGRVICGGSWYYSPSYARVANCYWVTPGNRINSLGFRLASSVR